MRYRKLDEDGDMTFGHGSKDYHQDTPEAVAQAVLTRLRLWRAEWYLDTSEGTPYMQEVFGRGTDSSSIRALRARVLETEGVRDILSFTAHQDPDTRKATFTIEIDTDYGETTVNG
jgi:hypothetical protein